MLQASDQVNLGPEYDIILLQSNWLHESNKRAYIVSWHKSDISSHEEIRICFTLYQKQFLTKMSFVKIFVDN